MTQNSLLIPAFKQFSWKHHGHSTVFDVLISHQSQLQRKTRSDLNSRQSIRFFKAFVPLFTRISSSVRTFNRPYYQEVQLATLLTCISASKSSHEWCCVCVIFVIHVQSLINTCCYSPTL